MSRDKLYLQHVLDAIGKIERYAAVGYDEFMVASHWQDAVIRQLEVIGEAVKRVSPEILGRRSDIPWRRIAGMRDVLVYDYMGVDWRLCGGLLRMISANCGRQWKSSWTSSDEGAVDRDSLTPRALRVYVEAHGRNPACSHRRAHRGDRRLLPEMGRPRRNAASSTWSR